MQTNYIRFGRRYSIPSTAQVLDELKTGFVANYVPINKGYNKPSTRTAAAGETHDRPPAGTRYRTDHYWQPLTERKAL